MLFGSMNRAEALLARDAVRDAAVFVQTAAPLEEAVARQPAPVG